MKEIKSLQVELKKPCTGYIILEALRKMCPHYAGNDGYLYLQVIDEGKVMLGCASHFRTDCFLILADNKEIVELTKQYTAITLVYRELYSSYCPLIHVNFEETVEIFLKESAKELSEVMERFNPDYVPTQREISKDVLRAEASAVEYLQIFVRPLSLTSPYGIAKMVLLLLDVKANSPHESSRSLCWARFRFLEVSHVFVDGALEEIYKRKIQFLEAVTHGSPEQNALVNGLGEERIKQIKDFLK